MPTLWSCSRVGIFLFDREHHSILILWNFCHSLLSSIFLVPGICRCEARWKRQFQGSRWDRISWQWSQVLSWWGLTGQVALHERWKEAAKQDWIDRQHLPKVLWLYRSKQPEFCHWDIVNIKNSRHYLGGIECPFRNGSSTQLWRLPGSDLSRSWNRLLLSFYSLDSTFIFISNYI